MHKCSPVIPLLAVIAALVAGCAAGPAQTPAATQTLQAPAVPPTTSGSGEARCTVVSQASATEAPTAVSPFPPPSAADWSVGPADAAVVFIEYGDFQCPLCARLAPALSAVQGEHPKDVRVIFRSFPLPQHDKALLAAQAAEAAGAQGKFWELHDLFYSHQADWQNLSAADFESWLKNQAKSLGLDVDKFETDLHADVTVQKVKKAQDDGLKIGMPGTPYLLINGRSYGYDAPKEKENLESVVQLYTLANRQFGACPPMTIDPHKQYQATLKTKGGDVVLQLYADKAPMTVNNFIFLARQGWYDGVTFHRVIPGALAQAGDPSGTGYGSPGYFFSNEIDPSLKFDGPGVLGMANAGPDSNGSQFFITTAAKPNLNGQYTIFGKVIQGLDVVQKLTPRDPGKGNNLPPGDAILSVTIEEK